VQAIDRSADSSRMTYAVAAAVDACRFYAGNLFEALNGERRKRCSPRVMFQSLEAALWAFFNIATFSEGCLMAINLGDDADTSGAIYGQLAGVF
jgi:ADP-ribosyl-[dinitrogen reductase] hydrolase